MSTRAEVYSWRLTPHLKSALEEAARDRGMSMAALLEDITREWLMKASEAHDAGVDPDPRQRRLRTAAARFFGAVSGGDPQRAERAGETVRARLAGKRAG